MNTFYKRAWFLGVLFSILYGTSFGSDWSHCRQIKLSLFTHEQKGFSANSRVHSDFSDHGTRSYRRESKGSNYREYAKQDGD